MGDINQTPYTEGVNARMCGRPIESNPHKYPAPFEKFTEWNDGWYEADKTTDDCENGRGNDGGV